MISSGFWNYLRMYCSSFSLNFLHWSLDFLCLDAVPKTVRQNPPLLPWSSWLMICMLGDWSIRIGPHVLGVRLFRNILLSRVFVPCCLNLIHSFGRHGWLLHHCRPHHCFPWKVRPFLFSESLYFNLYFWILLNLHYDPRSTWDLTPRVRSFRTR